jgi:uncharacterized damage-inducible protein DinB
MAEAWLRGPVEGVEAWLQPAAHALIQARVDLRAALQAVPEPQLWARPQGVASLGFHVLHVAGATDRLLTYARGASLDAAQWAFLAREKAPGPLSAEALLRELDGAVEGALTQIRATPRERLLEPRWVGRDRLPSTVLGLIFHAAEHAQRHAGQATTTTLLLRR